MIAFVCLLIAFVLSGLSYSGHAQQGFFDAGRGVEANFWMGSMIRHTPNFTGTLPRFSYAVELNYMIRTDGRKRWQQRRDYPEIGWGILGLNYGNPQVFGSVVGVYPLLYLPLWRRGSLEWTVRGGMGLGFVTQPYRRFPGKHTQNVAIGSHWNNVSPFSMLVKWQPADRWEFLSGVNFVHVSNAAFEKPNLGINVWGGHVGLRYFPGGNQPDRVANKLPMLTSRWLLQFQAGMAFEELSPADGPRYPIFWAAAYGSKRYAGKNKAIFGVDFSYRSGMYAFLKTIEDARGKEIGQSSQLALFAGNEFLFGRVGLVGQLGLYLKESYGKKNVFYEKIGAHIYVLQHERGWIKEVFVSGMLKAHLARAACFELGVGIGL